MFLSGPPAGRQESKIQKINTFWIPAFAGMMGRAWISAFPCLQVLAGQAANDKIYPLTSTMSLKFKLKSFSLTEEYRKKYHGFISPDLLSH